MGKLQGMEIVGMKTERDAHMGQFRPTEASQALCVEASFSTAKSAPCSSTTPSSSAEGLAQGGSAALPSSSLDAFSAVLAPVSGAGGRWEGRAGCPCVNRCVQLATAEVMRAAGWRDKDSAAWAGR
eukprot:450879-Pelagomonas_calceolata.AAC.6